MLCARNLTGFATAEYVKDETVNWCFFLGKRQFQICGLLLAKAFPILIISRSGQNFLYLGHAIEHNLVCNF